MALNGFLNKRVYLMLTDGRVLVGTLISCDQATNVALADSVERLIHEHDDPEPSIEEPRGVFVARGDSVVLCGLVDEELENSIDWGAVRGSVIGGTKHV